MLHAAAREARGLARTDGPALAEQFENRISLPEASACSIRAFTDEELRAHAHATAKILRRFVAAVADAQSHPDSPARFLRTLDLKTVSRDHDWRSTFATLRGSDANETPRLVAAIARYVEYLRERKSLIELVRSERRALEETDDVGPDTTRPFAKDGMRRLPMGEAVAVTLPYRAELRVRLGSHVFKLRDGYPPQLVDPEGRAVALAHGRQSIGRHPENDLVIDRRYNDVSRAHLLAEWNGGSVLHVTDLSSRGTYVERVDAGESGAA